MAETKKDINLSLLQKVSDKTKARAQIAEAEQVDTEASLEVGQRVNH